MDFAGLLVHVHVMHACCEITRTQSQSISSLYYIYSVHMANINYVQDLADFMSGVFVVYVAM